MMGSDNDVEQGENASTSSDFFIDSDEDELLSPQHDEGLLPEEPLTEKEIEELIDEFFQVESKAAEAQEALEGESLTKLEREVREELSQSLEGDDLEKAVAEELETYKEEWEAALDEFETESAHLLEQLDGAGISLPSLFKWIESQAPGTCSTEAWKKRAHWVGSQVTNELMETVAEAEKNLQTVRPIRRKHGRVLEEGASGFLQKKVDTQEIRDVPTAASTVDWGSFNKLVSDDVSENVASFGSKHWATVYLASTPQQAAQMGLKFPGVDEVEEIDDIDDKSGDPFIADALANESEIDLSEEQKKNFRKVKEEDDENLERKLQIQLKRRRQRRRSKKTSLEGVCLANQETSNLEMHTVNSSMNTSEDREVMANADFHESMCSKRVKDDEEQNVSNKRSRTMVIDIEDEEIAVCASLGKATKLNEQPDLVGKVDSAVGSVTSPSENEKFQCTACSKIAEEVHQHPLLKVIVCTSCKILMEEKTCIKDADCSECFCGWCGQSSDLLSCKSCDMLFCNTCILRNFGEDCLSKVKLSGWQCCCCSPSVLGLLTLQLCKAMESGDVIVSSSDSDSDTSVSDVDIEIRSKRKRKKKIRRIIDDAELGEDTRRKIAIEKERQERLRSLQVQFSARSKLMDSTSRNGIMSEGGGVDVLGDALTGYIVNVVREKGEEAVRIPPSISAKLKAHQLAGIRFMWENIVQSIRKVKSGDKGLGCILAHTMGLGKTFQVIAFLYTAMRSVDLGLKNALIVTPVNVLHNWRHEFTKWAPSEFKPVRVFMLDDVSRERRSALLAKWRAKGGVFLISYTTFRNLSFGKNVKDRIMARDIACALQDGPDILICDEAHMIKNTQADTTQALKLVRCQRRIALTGSPLQNNLMEYYCMVDFVREGFLGSSHEFRNRFQNPIENGQHTNSTAEDVKIMNQRSHILYEQLKGFVQRMDMNVVENDLPPKTVYVIAVKLSPLQRKLYKRFLDVHGFTTNHDKDTIRKRCFFAGYQALAQIWNHPGILQLTKDNRDFLRREDAVESFLVDESSSDEEMTNDDKLKGMDHSLNGKADDGFLKKDWWKDLLGENDYRNRDFSGKMVLLLDILTMSADVGDKALVFSQSIPTLDLIELYLSQLPRKGRNGKFWRKSKDWYRLDGSTVSSERQKLVEKFNDPTNKRVKCTLISTRAGSLGINLHAANRVIIVDGSWNPTYDLQAIYRAWRYGQTKPVFAYRLMAHGTMEEKIYKRQVTKEGLAARVVDRQQVHRTISKEEMLHLFEFGDDEIPESELVQQLNGHGNKEDMHRQVESAVKQKPSTSCSDKFMANLLSKYYSRWITNYHEHETLLRENEEEKLSKEEQDMAWEVFQKSLHWEEVQRVAPAEPATVKPVSANMATVKPVLANSATVKPVLTNMNTAATVNDDSQAKGNFRTRQVMRKCTNLSHLLTLRSQGTKVGCSTVCGECAQEISWENLNRDSHNKLKNGI